MIRADSGAQARRITRSMARPRPQPKRAPIARARTISRAPSRTSGNSGYALPRNFHTEAPQRQLTRHQRRFINKNARTEKLRVMANRENARRTGVFSRNPVAHLKRSEKRAVNNLAALAASDPKRYYNNVVKAHDKHIGPLNVTAELEGRGGLQKASHAAGKLIDKVSERTGGTKAGHGVYAGIGGDNRVGKEILDLAANTPSSLYLGAAGVKEAAQGRPHRIKKLWKDYKDTSAIPAAVSGNFKEAEKRALDHPVSTALELSGIKAVVGRGAGAVLRHPPVPHAGVRAAAKRVGATDTRPNLRLYPHAKPGEGPEIERRYSKDVINKGLQKAGERYQKSRGRDPHVDRGAHLFGQARGLPRRMGGSVVPGEAPRPHLNRRIDTRVFSQERAAGSRKSHAERQVRKITDLKLTARVPRKPKPETRLPELLRTSPMYEFARPFNPKTGKHERLPRKNKFNASAGIHLVGEGTARVGKIRGDLRKRLGSLAKERPALEDPERIRLNRDEAKHIRELLQLSDEQLNRVVGGAEDFAKQQAPVQARGLKTGTFTHTGQAKRFYPPLQAHVRRPGGEERVRGIHDEAAMAQALKSIRQRAQKGKPLPPRLRQAAIDAERAAAAHRVLPGQALAEAISNIALRRVPQSAEGKAFVGRRANRVFENYLRPAVGRTKHRVAVGARPLTPEELQTVSRVLQRRGRRGQSTLSGMVERRGPVFVSQKPGPGRRSARLGPSAPLEPTHERSGVAYQQGAREVGRAALEHQAISSEATVTAAEGHQLLDREFGIPAGKNGRRYAATYSEAVHAARMKTLDPKTGELKPDHIPLVPVNIAQFQTFGPRLRAKQEQGFPRDRASANDLERQATKDMWDAALNESGRGKWVLMPEDVVARLREHQNVGNFGPLHGLTNTFKDVVLTTSSPARWLGGNIGDIGTRTIAAGITPMDIMRGRRIVKQAAKQGLQGEQAVAAITGGGLYHASEALNRAFRPHGMHEKPARTILAAPWRTWKAGIYNLEHAIEELPQYGRVGKAMRQETPLGRHYAKADGEMATNLKSLMKLHDQQIDHFANKMANDRAFEARIQKLTEDVIGRWGKVSPNMRRALVLAPFAQWLGAAMRYTFVTLPVHHPIKTGLIAGIAQMTDKERQALGLSYFLPRDKQVYDYQMGSLPLEVGHNKYGPVVKGIRTSRMTSFGTAAGFPGNLKEFLMPQFAGAFNAWAGQSFTGDPLVYPDWWPDVAKRRLPIPPDERFKIGLGALIEGVLPFTSAFRRSVLEGGAPSEPYSTILTPAVRKKFDKQSETFVKTPGTAAGGIAEWLTPFAPKQRLYTYGSGKAIEEQGIAGEVLDKWRQQAKQKRGGDVFAPAPPNTKPTDLFAPKKTTKKADPRDIFAP